MNLLDIVQRSQPPLPWHEGDNIPWHEPAFSARMLAEHLSQSHDLASRRSHIIEQHVAWIHQVVLAARPARILDLGCGPGLYSNRLAAFGHLCTGIDYSPASITYAKETAAHAQLTVQYILQDIRYADYGSGFDLAMLLYGELNVFSRADAAHILAKTVRALKPGGRLLLEPHTCDSLIPKPGTSSTWYSSSSGLFAPFPHLVLMEQHWDEALAIVTRRYYVIDASAPAPTDNVTRYAQSMQAYTNEQYLQTLTAAGFTQIELLAGLAPERVEPPAALFAIIAEKPA